MKTTSCNGDKVYAFNNAPRCGAKTKHNNGLPCRSPAVRNKKRCRIHGGSKGSGAQSGNFNAVKHGLTTASVYNFKRIVKQVIKDSNHLIDGMHVDGNNKN